MKALLLLLSCSFFCQIAGLSQTEKLDYDDRAEMAQAAVNALRSGGLVVRLPTNAKKIAAMEAVLSEDELQPNNRGRLEQRLAQTIAETRMRNLLLISNLREQYQLGPLYFIPDTAYTLLQETADRVFFYNDQLELDPSIVQPNGDVLIMRLGYTDASETARAEAFILSNSALEDLVAPFPGAVTFDNLGFMFNKMLAPEIAERRRIEGAVKRLVKKLTIAVNREKW
jgi:hypothetical protein